MILLDKKRDGEVFTRFFACDGVNILQKTETAVKNKWHKRVKELKKSYQDASDYVRGVENLDRFARELRMEFSIRINYDATVAEIAAGVAEDYDAQTKALAKWKELERFQELLLGGKYDEMFEQCARVWARMPEEIPDGKGTQ